MLCIRGGMHIMHMPAYTWTMHMREYVHNAQAHVNKECAYMGVHTQCTSDSHGPRVAFVVSVFRFSQFSVLSSPIFLSFHVHLALAV
jgi:hypothetical protein